MLTAADVLDLLHRGIAKSEENHARERIERKGTDKRTGPFVSDLAGDCDLKLIRSFRDESGEDMDISGWVTVNMGHAFEEIVAQALGAVNVTYLRELSVEIPIATALETVTVNGRIDYLLLADDTLVELKGKGFGGYSYALDKNKLPTPRHKAQCQGYLHATQLGTLAYEHEGAYVTLPPQDRMVIVYCGFPPDWKDKNYDRPFAAFDVEYDAALIERHLQKAANLWRASRTDIPSAELAQKQNANYFPCASKRKDGTIKAWCAHYATCHGGLA